MKAFIVDLFYSRIQNRDAITGAGRLENGESFGFVDFDIDSRLYLRESDQHKTRVSFQNAFFTFSDSLLQTMDGEAVVALKTEHLQGLREMNTRLLEKGIRTYEGDLDYPTRYRIEKRIGLTIDIEGDRRPSDHVQNLFLNPRIRGVDAEIPLRALALDIETDREAKAILGFSLVSWMIGEDENSSKDVGFKASEEVHLLSQGSMNRPADMGEHVFFHTTEKDLLIAFQKRVLAIDPDILTGWNVIDFDLSVIERLCEKHRMSFAIGRTKRPSLYKKGRSFGRSKVVVQGRQVLDALTLARFTLFQFDDLRLGTVAKTLLGRGKTLELEEWDDAPDRILETFEKDPHGFVEYVLEDSRLVRDILKHQKLLELTIARARLTRLSLEKAWGSVVAFESLYIAELHQRGHVAPTLGVDQIVEGSGTGGLVLSPKVGLYSHVFVFDFKSLYPSLMRTFNIDPLALLKARSRGSESGSGVEAYIEAPNGACFVRESGILPRILDEFMEKREDAKRRRDDLESYTYKIVMNSFYGVLGTDACRFGDMALADAITGFGQKWLQVTRDHFESQGLSVLYGDTDSLFVKWDGEEGEFLSPEDAHARGRKICLKANEFLAAKIRSEYQLESKMELEFEKYLRFAFFPPDRQGDGGRAKNYAGLHLSPRGEEKLILTGIEAVRSDWTPLARRLQKELLKLLFHEATPQEMTDFLQEELGRMERGESDEELIYRKRIRRPLESYTKTTPPHIRAARLLPRPVRVVRYLMTDRGPEPIGFVKGTVDYRHYKEKQIRPIVENLARYAGFRTDDVLGLSAGAQAEFEAPGGFQFPGSLN